MVYDGPMAKRANSKRKGSRSHKTAKRLAIKSARVKNRKRKL